MAAALFKIGQVVEIVVRHPPNVSRCLIPRGTMGTITGVTSNQLGRIYFVNFPTGDANDGYQFYERELMLVNDPPIMPDPDMTLEEIERAEELIHGEYSGK